MPHEHEDDDQGREARLSGREVATRIAPYALRYRAELLQATGLLITVVALGLLGPLLLGQIVDLATASSAIERPFQLPVTRDRDGVLTLAALFVVVVVLGFLLEAALGFLMSKVGVDCTLRLKEDLFRHVLGLDPAFYREYPPGRLIARIESDTEAIKNLFTSTAMQAIRAALTFFGIFAMMLAFDPRTTLFVLPVVLALAVATVFFTRMVRDLWKEARRRFAALTALLTEYVQGASVVQAYGYEDHARARMQAENLARYKVEVKGGLINQSFWGFFAFSEAAVAALVIWVGVSKVLDGQLTLGTLIIFLEYVRQAFMPVAMLSEFVSQVQQGFVAAGRVFGILSLRPAAPDLPGARTDVALAERVRFEDVRFSYDGKVEALRGVSFDVPRGAQVALVGASGGGKSTIVSLLLRFHEPTAGRVTVDGADLRGVARDAWRRKVGLVLQDVNLFPGTLGDNLTVFDAERDPAEVERACKIVGADALLRRLPEGLSTALAERGANLSMGERQLVSLARALVHDPALLVLDEATSAIDPRTEAMLQESLARLLSGRTALIVAHRLATVRRCDEILVVDGGQIVERGTHDELWARDGAYRRLAALQFPELRVPTSGTQPVSQAVAS